MGNGQVQRPRAHDFPEQEEAQHVLACRHANQTAAHGGKGAVEAPLAVAVFHVAKSVGHVDRTQHWYQQGKAERKRIKVAAKQHNQQRGEQQHTHAGPAGLFAVAVVNGRDHRTKHRHNHKDGPRNFHGDQHVGVGEVGREAQGGHGHHKVHGKLRGKAHDDADCGQNSHANLHAARHFRDCGQVGGAFFKHQGFKNARVVDQAHQRTAQNQGCQPEMTSGGGRLNHHELAVKSAKGRQTHNAHKADAHTGNGNGHLAAKAAQVGKLAAARTHDESARTKEEQVFHDGVVKHVPQGARGREPCANAQHQGDFANLAKG